MSKRTAPEAPPKLLASHTLFPKVWNAHPSTSSGGLPSKLSLILELRSEDGDFELFVGFADGMLDEKEFFIRKSIGWVLREASKARPELVYDYLLNRIKRVSGLTLREGSKRLPERQRERLLALYAKK